MRKLIDIQKLREKKLAEIYAKLSGNSGQRPPQNPIPNSITP